MGSLYCPVPIDVGLLLDRGERVLDGRLAAGHLLELLVDDGRHLRPRGDRRRGLRVAELLAEDAQVRVVGERSGRPMPPARSAGRSEMSYHSICVSGWLSQRTNFHDGVAVLGVVEHGEVATAGEARAACRRPAPSPRRTCRRTRRRPGRAAGSRGTARCRTTPTSPEMNFCSISPPSRRTGSAMPLLEEARVERERLLPLGGVERERGAVLGQDVAALLPGEGQRRTATSRTRPAGARHPRSAPCVLQRLRERLVLLPRRGRLDAGRLGQVGAVVEHAGVDVPRHAVGHVVDDGGVPRALEEARTRRRAPRASARRRRSRRTRRPRSCRAW